MSPDINYLAIDSSVSVQNFTIHDVRFAVVVTNSASCACNE